MTAGKTSFIHDYDDLSSGDIHLVGGKNASLGELVRGLKDAGVRVPKEFATSAEAYWLFLDHNQIGEHIADLINGYHDEEASLDEVGQKIRDLFMGGEFPEA